MVLAADNPVETQDLPDWYVAELRRRDKPLAGLLGWRREPSNVNSLAHFEWFVNHLTLEDGRPMRLEPFQRLLLAGYFAGVTETAIILPKKNGKTMIMALLALHHMIFEVDEADVIIAASSKEQAAKLYQYAEGLILRNPRLSAVVKPQGGYRRIVFVDHKLHPGSIRIIPNDPTTADGQACTLAIVDEYHRHKSAEIYGLLRDGLPARTGKLLSISTAGESDESPLGHLRQQGHALPIRFYEGRHLFAVNEDVTFCFHEWALADEDDVEDFGLVALANPLSIHTTETLKTRFASPSMMLWQWRRFIAGLWGITEGGVLDAVSLRRCGGGEGLLPGESCWLGMDIGWRRDTTALVPFLYDPEAPISEQEVVGVPTIIPAPGGGRDTKPETIIAAIKAINDVNPIEAIVFDPNAEGHLIAAKIGEELDIPIVEHSQDPFPMALSSMALAEKIRAHQIVFPTNAHGKKAQEQVKLLMKHLASAGAKSDRYGSDKWRFVKQADGMHVDGAIALAIVRRARVEGLGKPKKRKEMSYEETAELYGQAA